MSSELSHGISRLINHPLLLRLLLLHPAGLSSVLALALPPLCPTISCSSTVSWHLPASVSLSWHSQGSFPRQMQRGFHHVVGLGMNMEQHCSGRGGWTLPGVEDAVQCVRPAAARTPFLRLLQGQRFGSQTG